MRDSQSDSVMQPRLPSLCLEYGADEEHCEMDLEICERGMSFYSHWQFTQDTEVGVSLCYNDESGVAQRARLVGIVVDCQPASPEHCQPAALRCHKVTVLFVDVPEAFLATIRDVSSLLEPARQPAPKEPTPSLAARRQN